MQRSMHHGGVASAGRDYRDGAVVPFYSVKMLLRLELIVLSGARPYRELFWCNKGNGTAIEMSPILYSPQMGMHVQVLTTYMSLMALSQTPRMQPAWRFQPHRLTFW